MSNPFADRRALSLQSFLRSFPQSLALIARVLVLLVKPKRTRLFPFLIIGLCLGSAVAQAQVTNLALGKPATQSSTYPQTAGFPYSAPSGFVAGLAVDGDPNTISHTAWLSEAQPWWQVDLGSVAASIDTIEVWHRADCCPEQLSNFYVFVSDTPFSSTNLNNTIGQSGVSSYPFAAAAGRPTGIPIGRTGRYVRIQLANPATEALSIAEVRVLGTAGGSQPGITLSYLGKVQDKVGPGEQRGSADGIADGTFQATLTGGARTVTRLDLRRSDGNGVWDTTAPNGFWTLGASSTLGGALVNSANDAVNFAVADGSNFYLYAAEFINAQFPNGLLLPGFTFTLTANFSDGRSATAPVTLSAGGVALASIAVNPPSVVGGASATGTATLTAAAPTGGAVVTLTSSDTSAATVPASITVPAGQTSATFTISTVSVTSVKNVTITGSYGGASPTATLTVTATGGQPSLTLSYLGKVQDKVGPGEQRGSADGIADGTFQATLTGGARTVTRLDLRRSDGNGVWDTTAPNGFWTLGASSTLGGALVNSANDAVNFAVADGSNFYLYAAEFINAQFPNGLLLPGFTFTLTANFSDGRSATAPVTLSAGGVALASIAVNPPSVVGGASATGTATLTAAAPTGGAVVTLTSSDTSAATVPASITVPAGQTSATFTISTVSVTSVKNVTITGSYGGASPTATLTVTATGGQPSLTLSYLGKVQDKVGPGEQRGSADGIADGTFQATLTGGARTVTRLDLRRSDGNGVWDTTAPNGFWTLGASSTLGGALVNSANDAVNFAVADGSNFYLYAAEFINAQFPNGLLLPGFTFTLTANFADGTSATVPVTLSAVNTVTVTGINPTQGTVGSTVPVTLTGTNFQSGATLSVGAGITVSNVAVSSATQLTATLAIAVGATLGTRDVTVTNPGGLSGMLTGGFSVATTTATGDVNYFYDRLGRLIAVITGTETAIYQYDPVGNLLSITRQSSAAVSIIDFSPHSGPANTMVTIYGTGFSSTKTQNTVTFNGLPATVTSASTTRLVVQVPSGVSLGPIMVTSPNGFAGSAKSFGVSP